MTTPEIASWLCPTQVHFGAGAHARIAEVARARGASRVFVVVDPAVRDTAFFAAIRARLDDAGLARAEFDDVRPDPGADAVHAAFDACTDHRADLLLAVGGGSAIDTAKAVGILATNGGRIHDYEGIEKFATPPLPLIAVPTTAGTGSEVSGSCVITDDASGRKMSVRHARLNPAAVAILDPLGLATLPAHVAAHAGLDAFVHAFESFVSRQANLITDAVNLQAITLLSENLRPFVAHRGNVDAALNTLVGACLAGMTFGQTGLGNVHCLARFVGARFHLSHGLSNAVCLPEVARFNLIACPDKYARVAAAMGRPVAGLPVRDAAQAAVEAIERLCRDLGIPSRLREVGADPATFDAIAEDCTRADYSRWNPRQTTTANFRALLDAAY